MKNRGIKIVLKLAALAITLPHGGIAAVSSLKPVVVTRVACYDNEYGLAMESAILEGNIQLVDALLSRYRKSINDVLAVCGVGGDWTTSDATSFYKKKADSEVPSGYAAFTTSTYNPVSNPYAEVAQSVSKKLFPTLKGDVHCIWGTSSHGLNWTLNLLGTPLMIAARARNRVMVAELLKRGANPNVFIEVQDYQLGSYYEKNKKATGTWTCRRPYLCALFDVYLQMEPATMDRADAIAKMLLDHGATFYKRPDGCGRTAIWDAARLKSSYLLSEMARRGFDLNIEDNVSKTIGDWISQERPSYSPEAALWRQFITALPEMGVKVPDTAGPQTKQVNQDDFVMVPSERETARQNAPGVTGVQPLAYPLPVMQKPDNSAEIARLQSRIWKLRMELEDARGNERAATIQGTGWVTASMRTTNIMQEIKECEDRIMELRN